MDHPFKVGEVFRNRTGKYKTIRVDERRGTMLVRYLDSGEEAELSIAVQARIWRNMDWEEHPPVEDDRHGHGLGLKRQDYYFSSPSASIRHTYCGRCGAYLNSRKNPHCARCHGIICYECGECFC